MVKCFSEKKPDWSINICFRGPNPHRFRPKMGNFCPTESPVSVNILNSTHVMCYSPLHAAPAAHQILTTSTSKLHRQHWSAIIFQPSNIYPVEMNPAWAWLPVISCFAIALFPWPHCFKLTSCREEHLFYFNPAKIELANVEKVNYKHRYRLADSILTSTTDPG